MDHEQRIKRAIKLLKPKDEASARRYLQQAIEDVEKTRRQNQHLEDMYSKESRKALNEFRASLRRTAAAYKKLPKGMAQTFGILIEQAGLHTPALTGAAEIAKSMQDERLRRRSKLNYVKLGAAANAWNLFGLLELAEPQRPKRKTEPWPQLAAILAGSSESFQPSCRLYYEQAVWPKVGARSGPKKSTSRI